jgi:tRNA threonylcarbamoyladenosine biosynthesis protein TsaB
MHLLAIDTATNSGGVALSRNSEVIGLTMVKAPLRYSDTIIQTIDFLLQQLCIELREIDCLCVASGPGSFTGLRIGIATAKGMCQALSRPAVGISNLEALAWRFRWFGGRVAPMIDARRQQVYGAVYAVTDNRLCELQEGTVQPPAEWLRNLPDEECVFVGDGAQMYARTIEAIRPKGRVLATDNCILRELCELGYRRYTQGEIQAAEQLRAHYIRPSDAEMAR